MSVEKATVTTKRKSSGWAGQVMQLAGIVAAVFIAKGALAEPFYVPSGSMEPTLLIGDQLLATKYAYGYSAASLPSLIVLPTTRRVFDALPERGDVVVFRLPRDRSQHYVKRVIGLPGDRIALVSGTLWINGAPVKLSPDGIADMETEDGAIVAAPRFFETLPGGRTHAILKTTGDGPYDDVAEFVVPADHLFVLGDNRDNSADSRVPVEAGGVGLLPTGNLVGRVNTLLGSWDRGITNQPIWTWPSGLRLARFFAAVR
jgi:signal peptidase I